MKKTIALALALIMLLTLAACAGVSRAEYDRLQKEYDELLDDYKELKRSGTSSPRPSDPDGDSPLGQDDDDPFGWQNNSPSPSPSQSGSATAEKTISVWSFTDEVPNIIMKYKELNPGFPYNFIITIISDTYGAYQPALDQALGGSGGQSPDIYTAEAAFVLKYSQGDAKD
ncbi:MAG: hypothetical protein LBI44_02780, partial [Oscillospiraceae bacterium]|nr:hypothetical protein [Oscillospiraceae bacterium]